MITHRWREEEHDFEEFLRDFPESEQEAIRAAHQDIAHSLAMLEQPEPPVDFTAQVMARIAERGVAVRFSPQEIFVATVAQLSIVVAAFFLFVSSGNRASPAIALEKLVLASKTAYLHLEDGAGFDWVLKSAPLAAGLVVMALVSLALLHRVAATPHFETRT